VATFRFVLKILDRGRISTVRVRSRFLSLWFYETWSRHR
jgi:hypothetical protein